MKESINFPAPENYAETVNSEIGIKELIEKSSVEALLRKLDDQGYEVSAALIELIAMQNYISQNLKTKEKIKTHMEYILNELNR